MVVGRVFSWWDVANGTVQACLVPPVHPLRGGELYVLERAPGPLFANELGRVQAVHRFGAGIVLRVAARAHRAHRTGLGQSFRVADREVLTGFKGSLQHRRVELQWVNHDGGARIVPWCARLSTRAHEVAARPRRGIVSWLARTSTFRR